MLRPKIPNMPTPHRLSSPPVIVEPTVVERYPSTPAPLPAPTRPTVQITPGTALVLVGGGTAVVLVVGTVLVSMLLAVAVTAASVAVCALVVRSLITTQHRR